MAKLLEPFGGGLTCDDPEKNVFDIHAGGIDLVFPHHENEIAQSCCAFGTERMANIWMHNGFLQVEGRKMSKSEGNFVTINELLREGWDGRVLRLLMLKTHYRQPIDWTREGLQKTSLELHKLARHVPETSSGDSSMDDKFVRALADDLNTPQAIAELHRIAGQTLGERTAGATNVDASTDRAYAHLWNAFELLGFSDVASFDANVMFARMHGSPEIDDERVRPRIAERLTLIAEKNWAEADKIRDELLAQGIQLKDGKDPVSGERVTTWEVKR
jgi:cysteinyl-tRNA synthetase